MMKNVLKVAAAVGIAALGVTALMKSNLLPKLKEKFHDYDAEFEKKNV